MLIQLIKGPGNFSDHSDVVQNCDRSGNSSFWYGRMMGESPPPRFVALMPRSISRRQLTLVCFWFKQVQQARLKRLGV